MSSDDKLCKQFGHTSGPIKYRLDLVPKCLTVCGISERFLKVILKQSADNKKHAEFHSQELRSMGGSRGGTGGPYPLKNHKNKGFLSNTRPDP